MEMERVQMMASDSIDSVVENSFGGNRQLALMVKSRSLVLPKSLTLSDNPPDFWCTLCSRHLQGGAML